MSESQIELLKMIKEHKNPEEAIKMTLAVIITYLEQHESCSIPSADHLQESLQKTSSF